MAQLLEKINQAERFQIVPSGGVNYSDTDQEKADNECDALLNFIYNTDSTAPESRSGVTAASDNAAAAYPITAIYKYNSYILGVCNQKLYYLDATPEWQEIGSSPGDGALNGTKAKVSFLPFNDQLLIGSGGALQTWDGTPATALADVTGSDVPASGWLLEERDQRVVMTSPSGDTLYLSQVENETVWTTTGSPPPGYAFNLGYLDDDDLKGIAVFGDDLLIIKGPQRKRIYKLVGHDDDTYEIQYVREGHSCYAAAVLAENNDVYMVDENGFKSITGIQEYGDLAVLPEGEHIYPQMNLASTAWLGAYPKAGQIWVCDNTTSAGRTFVYHWYNKRWSVIEWAGSMILNAMFYDKSDGTLYLGFDDGYLYTYSGSTDNGTAFDGTLITKKWERPGVYNATKLLQNITAKIKPITAGTARLYLVKDGISKLIAEISVLSAAHLLGGSWASSTKFGGVTTLLGAEAEAQLIRNTNFYECYDYQFKLALSDGARARLLNISGMVNIIGEGRP